MISGGAESLSVINPSSRPRDFPGQPTPRQPVTARQPENPGRSAEPPRFEAEAFQRRVQARAQVEAARLERFDADVVPPQNRQALDLYNEVAAAGQPEPGVELARLDIRV